MKASLKFRDEQKPLFRAKVPVSILGLPFQSGIVAGESKELSLNLGTFFSSGPSLKIGYRPNDSINPFSLVFKTGIGHFGSPISSSMTMTAEFNLIGDQKYPNPKFFVHFKPNFGDFSLKKSQSSDFSAVQISKSKFSDEVSGEDESVETSAGNREFVLENGVLSGRKIKVLQVPESAASGVVRGLFSGLEVSARTCVPVRNRAVVNFRWGVRFPAELTNGDSISRVSFNSLPILVMNKIGIEHFPVEDSKVYSDRETPDMTDACLNLKQQLDVIQSENVNLRKSIDEMKSEFGKNSGRYSDRYSNGDKKSFESMVNESDVNEELKKGLSGA
ncbi:hypothetical protein LguiA_014481 [Lonicera macranthoides]